MPKSHPGRRIFDTGSEFFDKLAKLTSKESPAEVLQELRRGYLKWKNGIAETEKILSPGRVSDVSQTSGTVLRPDDRRDSLRGPVGDGNSRVDDLNDPFPANDSQERPVGMMPGDNIGEPARDHGESDPVSDGRSQLDVRYQMTTQESRPEHHGSISPGQTTLSFVPTNFREDLEEQKLVLRGQELALETRKQDFREQAFERILEFKRELLNFEKSKRHILPMTSVEAEGSAGPVYQLAKPVNYCSHCDSPDHRTFECPKSMVNQAIVKGTWR